LGHGRPWRERTTAHLSAIRMVSEKVGRKKKTHQKSKPVQEHSEMAHAAARSTECGVCGDEGPATGEVVHAVGGEHCNVMHAGART
jgi:hypothetical protein